MLRAFEHRQEQERGLVGISPCGLILSSSGVLNRQRPNAPSARCLDRRGGREDG